MYGYVVRHRVLYIIYAVLLVVSSAMSVLFAFVLSEIFNCAQNQDPEHLMAVSLGGILFLLVSVLVSYCYGVVKNDLICKARLELKNDLFRKILRKSALGFESRNLGEYMNELQNNLNLYEELYFHNILQIPLVIFSFAIAVGVCLYISPIVLVLIVAMGILISVMVKKLGNYLAKTTADFTERSAIYTSEIKDYFQGHRTILAYCLHQKVLEKHGAVNEEMEGAKKTNENGKILFFALNELAGMASTLLIMAIAACFAIRGDFSIGIVMAFGQLSGKIISPIMTASDTWVQLKSSKALTENYRRILSEEEAAGPKEKKHMENGDVRLCGVSFALGEHPIFENFTETFQRGRKYLVIGESGKGKSTLLHLIAGLYPADKGSVTVGGVTLEEADAASVSRLITLVSQEVFLFHDSIRNNITLFEDCAEEKLQAVLRQCGLEALIAGLPDGLDTVVRENGTNFSGGEKQRINLARAFMKDSPILLLDEVTANLDTATTAYIENAILSLEGKTVISVSHKMPEEFERRYDEIVRL